MSGRQRCLSIAFALALGACGGNIDLGGPSTIGSPSPFDQGGASGNESPVDSQQVARLDELFSARGIAIAGDGLYLSGRSREGATLYRCSKNRCEESLERLVPPDGGLSALQSYEDRLAGARGGFPFVLSFVSYALPSVTDEQVAIRDLYEPGRPTFYDGFVYWAMQVDRGVYRCSLPACSNGPQRLGQGSGDVAIAGRFVFSTLGGSRISRALLDVSEPAQELLVDEQLGLAPADVRPDITYSVSALAGTTEHLYAAVGDERDYPEQRQPTMVVRWPTEGGNRQTMLEEHALIGSLRVFGDELVWTVGTDYPLWDWTLQSCSVNACAETRRVLGRTSGESPSATADENHLYWLAGERDTDAASPYYGKRLDREIRRVSLLAGPK